MAYRRVNLAWGEGGRLSDIRVEATTQKVKTGSCLSLELHRNHLESIERLVADAVAADLRAGTPVPVTACEGRPIVQVVRRPFTLFAFLEVSWVKAPGAWAALEAALARNGVDNLVSWRLDLLEPAEPGEVRCGLFELIRGDCGVFDLVPKPAVWAIGAAFALVLAAPALNALAAYYAYRARMSEYEER